MRRPTTEKGARSWWWWVTVGGALVAGGAYYLSTNEVLKKSAQAEEAEAAYRTAGFAWTAREVRPDLPVSPDQDAWPILQRISATFDPVKFEKLEHEYRDRFKRGSSINYSLFRLPYPTEAEGCAAAASKPKLSLGHDYDLGAGLEYREAPLFKGLVGCLCLRAAIQSRQGADSEVLGSLNTAWKLANLLGQEPLLFDCLVEIHCKELVLRQIEECATIYRRNPGQLKRMRAILDDEKPVDLVACLRGQAYLSLSFVRNLEASWKQEINASSHVDGAQLLRDGIPKNKEVRAMAVRVMEGWVRLKRVIDADANDPIKLGEDIDAFSSAQNRNREANGNLFFQPLGPDVLALLKCDAEVTSTKALLAALASAPDDSVLPGSIRDIPGSWTDPFTGEPLLLKKTEHSLTISSVGSSSKKCAGLMKGVHHSVGQTGFVGASYPAAH